MRKYKKNFLEFYNYGIQDRIMCWDCGKYESVDLHHIEQQSHGGTDEVTNLIPLCRVNCHDHDTSYLKNNKERHFSIVKAKIKEMEELGYLKEQFV